jgi:hypothetical protein
MKRSALLVIPITALVATLTIPLGGSTATGPSGAGIAGNFGLARAKAFTPFSLYWLGTGFEELPLVASFRRLDERDPVYPIRANFVSFVYGRCSASNGVGCAPPLEVQIWPACERNPSVYDWTPSEAAAIEVLRVRGVPARFYDGGRRLELSTGSSTVVVFGQTREQLLRAARGLAGVNIARNAGEALPAPVAGAVQGRLTCE